MGFCGEVVLTSTPLHSSRQAGKASAKSEAATAPKLDSDGDEDDDENSAAHHLATQRAKDIEGEDEV